jgi:polyphosphate kinase 2 (PPK2 family)
VLDQVDLSLALSKTAFKRARRFQRQRLYDLAKMAFDARLPTMIVFEGWDAAGKGTTIRELTRRLDPRGFQVHPVQAPRTMETRMPWLWRFWMKIPDYGQMAIFDRSWYGRVMIERVEKLTPIPDWIRAYEEINQFERTLAADGMVFIKFWLHISRQEQLRRFLLISKDPARAWQVAAEDWERHRDYDEYAAAVADMLANTHTSYAPWTVVPATDPYYRVYRVFQVIIDTLEQALGAERTEWDALDALEEKAARAEAHKKKRKAAKKARKAAQEEQTGAAEQEEPPAAPAPETARAAAGSAPDAAAVGDDGHAEPPLPDGGE